MCLWFACFGLHKHDDDCYAPPHRGLALPPSPPAAGAGATKPLHDRPMPAAQRNGYHHGHGHYGNGAHHQTAADEAGRKASNDARKAFTYAGAAETVSRQPPAWNGRVSGEAGHGHGAQAPRQQHYYDYYERQPVHREGAMDRHYYTTATGTADRERY